MTNKNLKIITLTLIFLLLIPQLYISVLVARIRISIEAGWPLDGLSYFSIFFNFLDFRADNSILPSLVSTILFFIFITLVVFYFFWYTHYVNTLLILFLCSFIFMLFLAELVYGFNSYKGWKLISFVLSFLVPIVLVMVIYLLNRSSVLGFLGLMIFFQSLSSPFIIWRDLIFDPYNLNSGFIRTTRPELLEIPEALRSSLLGPNTKLESVNVDLSDYLETMILYSLLEVPNISLISKSYYNPDLNPNTCTISFINNLKYLNFNQIKLNDYYSIYTYPSKCYISTAAP
jgi:hypothetical protein